MKQIKPEDLYCRACDELVLRKEELTDSPLADTVIKEKPEGDLTHAYMAGFRHGNKVGKAEAVELTDEEWETMEYLKETLNIPMRHPHAELMHKTFKQLLENRKANDERTEYK